MKTIILMLLIMLSPSLNGFGQQKLERGTINELQGLIKVFVDTGRDTEARRAIVDEIEKARLGIEFTKTIEESSILLKFNGRMEKMMTGATLISNSSAIKPNDARLSVGQGIVALAGQDNLRVLMNYGKPRQSKLHPQSAARFAREFVRLYREANRPK